jgi:hypothetical protein
VVLSFFSNSLASIFFSLGLIFFLMNLIIFFHDATDVYLFSSKTANPMLYSTEENWEIKKPYQSMLKEKYFEMGIPKSTLKRMRSML